MSAGIQRFPRAEAAVCRPASPAQWSACRMLLPESFVGGARPELWLALDVSTGVILGAAAARVRESALHQMRIRVARPFRRQGVGSMLLDEMVAGGPSAIYAAASSGEPDAEPFLLARGFTRTDRIFLVEGDLMLLRDRIFSLRDRLLATGRIPADIEILRPADAPAGRLATLFAEHVVPFREFRAGHAMPIVVDPRFAESPVLCVGGEPQGMVLYESDADSGVGRVHARLVTEPYRGGWANVVLMAAAIDRGLARGVRRLRFEAPESNPDTMKLMRRVRAEILQCTSCFARPLEGV